MVALAARQPGRDVADMLCGHEPEDLRWGPVVARMAEASLPALDSVMPKAASFAPDAIWGRYFFFCSSLP